MTEVNKENYAKLISLMEETKSDITLRQQFEKNPIAYITEHGIDPETLPALVLDEISAGGAIHHTQGIGMSWYENQGDIGDNFVDDEYNDLENY